MCIRDRGLFKKIETENGPWGHGGADGASASALSNTTKTKSCFLPLLHVLTIHKKFMSLNMKLLDFDWCLDYVGKISADQSALFSHVTFSRPIRSEYLERLREFTSVRPIRSEYLSLHMDEDLRMIEPFG